MDRDREMSQKHWIPAFAGMMMQAGSAWQFAEKPRGTTKKPSFPEFLFAKILLMRPKHPRGYKPQSGVGAIAHALCASSSEKGIHEYQRVIDYPGMRLSANSGNDEVFFSFSADC